MQTLFIFSPTAIQKEIYNCACNCVPFKKNAIWDEIDMLNNQQTKKNSI